MGQWVRFSKVEPQPENPMVTSGIQILQLDVVRHPTETPWREPTHLQRAVYKRLKKFEGNQIDTENELRDIGAIFRAGNIPTETSFTRTRINGVVK